MLDQNLVHLLVIVPITLFGYYLLPRRVQNYWLLLWSYLLYASVHWAFPVVLLAMTITNYVLAQELADSARKRPLLIGGIALNIALVVSAKYFSQIMPYLPNSVTAMLLRGLRVLEIRPTNGLLSLLLPLGLSFRMLEMISYLVDVSSGRMKPTADLVDFTLYVAYFPKLFAGPIERARTFLPKLAEPRIVDNDLLARAFMLIVVGAVRKIVFADALRGMMPRDLLNAPYKYDGAVLALWLVGYAFALYNDFAGYTSMMRGISLLFGIEMAPNFEQPYFARSITEFWNRWHMSFSFWLRDYIFFPISRILAQHIPNRSYWAHILLPPLITMIVSALWHSVALSMLLWGLLHAFYMIGWRLSSLRRPILPLDKQPFWRQAIAILLTFTLVLLAWVPFVLPLPLAVAFYRGLMNWTQPPVLDERVVMLILGTFLIDVVQARSGEFGFLRLPRVVQAGLLASALIILFLMSHAAFYSGNPFIYQGF